MALLACSSVVGFVALVSVVRSDPVAFETEFGCQTCWAVLMAVSVFVPVLVVIPVVYLVRRWHGGPATRREP